MKKMIVLSALLLIYVNALAGERGTYKPILGSRITELERQLPIINGESLLKDTPEMTLLALTFTNMKDENAVLDCQSYGKGGTGMKDKAFLVVVPGNATRGIFVTDAFSSIIDVLLRRLSVQCKGKGVVVGAALNIGKSPYFSQSSMEIHQERKNGYSYITFPIPFSLHGVENP